MTDPMYQIPEEYQSQLKYVESNDNRTDAEILDALTKHAPITSEKNIWTFWHAGVQQMPEWTQRNIINWVRLHGPEWTIRVLDTVPDSLNHALTWISTELLPETFVKGTMTGPYVGPHSADFLRGAALYTYGGVWMDVGCIVFRHLDKVCWDQLGDDSSPFTVAAPLVHLIFLELWKGRTDFTGVVQSPLISFIKQMNNNALYEAGFKWEWKVDEQTLIGYIGQCLAWIRLTWLQEPNGGFDGVTYWAEKILLWHALSEDFPAENTLGFDSADFMKLLTMRVDADESDVEYEKARKATWGMLTQSVMQKITHGKGLGETLHIGTLLDLPENEGIDAAPGTLGGLLRYGSVHLEQTRDMPYIKAPAVDPKCILRKGLLEA
ncbi:hypothetical protein J4E91_000003 [Alternaria rosae]|nr:hypothetical protein J4E91_000003 [Alternaria rosae]